jgi:hypothetical protein
MVLLEWQHHLSGFCAERRESGAYRMAAADQCLDMAGLCCAARQVQSAVLVLSHSLTKCGLHMFEACCLVCRVSTVSCELFLIRGECLHGLAWDRAVSAVKAGQTPGSWVYIIRWACLLEWAGTAACHAVLCMPPSRHASVSFWWQATVNKWHGMFVYAGAHAQLQTFKHCNTGGHAQTF